jgi:RNA polymerase sigma-70 factor (ECF subfamily)
MNDNEEADDAVLARLHAQPELVGVLYERHAPAVFRFLARRTGAAAAEDLLSEVFIAALGARAQLVAHQSGSALPWLYGISVNVVRHHLRRAAPPNHAMVDPGVDWDAVAARLDAQAQRSQLVAALSALTPVERDLLLLVAWEGLTPAQAADALGISKVAARSRLHRARQRAAQALVQAAQPAAAIRPTWQN